MAPAVSVTGSFSGIANTGWSPPDPSAAVGPNYVVETVNQSMAIFSKGTGTLVSQKTLQTLFSGFTNGGVNDPGMFDPCVLYDDQAGRFVIEAQVRDSTNDKAYIDISISNSSDPTQGFSEIHQIEVDQGGQYWSDNGKIGFNADAYVFTGNLFTFSGLYSTELVLTINKSSVLDQNNNTLSDYQATFNNNGASPDGFSLIPARMHGASAGGPMWFIQTNFGGSTSLMVTRMNNVLSSTPTFTTVSVPVNSYLNAASGIQPNGTIDPADCRTLNVEWNNNYLAGAFISSAGTDPAAAWIEINTRGSSPALVQQGVIHPGSGISTYMPAVAVDSSGDLGLTYMESSSSEYASMYVTGRLASDPAGTIEAPVRVATGTTTISNRVGDYSGISLDPSSANTFWAASEYGLRGWGTWLAAFQLPSTGSQSPTVVTPATANPNPVTGISANLSVLGADNSGEASLTYAWSLQSGPAGAPTPAFSANGTNAAKNTTATFAQAGPYTFLVTITDPAHLTTTSTVTVTVNQTLASLIVSPTSASLLNNGIQQFQATALDQFGKALTSQPTFNWFLSGIGSLSSTGLYTAPSSGTGSATVTAAYGSIRATASINVAASSAPSVATPASANPNPVMGTTASLSVLGADNTGEASLIYTWSLKSGPAGVPAPVFSANGTNAAKNTTASLGQAGSYTFQVTITDPANLSTTSTVTVGVYETIASLTLSPTNSSLVNNGTEQLKAAVLDQFGKALASQPPFSWSLSGIGSLSSTGLYTAPSAGAGSATITAAYGSLRATASVNIGVGSSPPTVGTPAIANPNPVTGISANLSVMGADNSGEASLTYAWSLQSGLAGAPAPAFSANGTNAAKNTTATFAQAGSYTFLVTITDPAHLTTTSTVTVTVNQTVTSLIVSPTSAAIINNGTQQFQATALDQFGKALASQPTFSWSVIGIGTLSSTGLYTAPGSGTGSATATAAYGSIRATASINVAASSAPTVATPASANPNPVMGTTASLSVLGADNTGEASLIYTWSLKSGPAGAPTPVFSANGTNAAKNTTASLGQAGSYTFQVTITDPAKLSTTSAVTVGVYETIASLTLSPASSSLVNNGTEQLKAAVLDQFGKALASQPPFSWSLSGIGSLSSTGLYTAPSAGAGFATVTAGYGSFRATASITVTAVSAPETAINLTVPPVHFSTPRTPKPPDTDSGPDADVPAFGVLPTAPSNLTALAVSVHQVNLSWDAGSANATGYVVERLGSDGAWEDIAQIDDAAITRFSDTTVNPNDPYQYRVFATNDVGNSPFSNVSEAVRPNSIKSSVSQDPIFEGLEPNVDWKQEVSGTLLRFLGQR
jgi:hypothetical protein